jgi:hypothetical protein
MGILPVHRAARSPLDVADDADGEDGHQLGAALFGRHRSGVGRVDHDAARGHRHLSEESMPTTTSAARLVRRPADPRPARAGLY